jgi:hypothetical protein
MKSSDKFLIAIVAGIILLVVMAFVLTLNREEPTYQAEDTPEGIAFNYLLAIQKEEYARAYGYLSPSLRNYPATLEDFKDDIADNPWDFRDQQDATLIVRDLEVIGDRATVKIYETRYYGSGGLFDSGQYTYAFNMKLQLEDGVWKIVYSPYYFAWCWTHSDKCE